VSTKDNLKMVSSMEKEYFNGLMDQYMKETGSRVKYKAEVFIDKQMVEVIKVNGKIT
jgi:hypothetical protein